jgi:hypothetical protein
MDDGGIMDWHRMNQAHLGRALEDLKQSLRRCAGDPKSAPEDVAPPGRAPVDANPPALEIVTNLFDLSRFERLILLLCAGVELDSEVAGLCAAAHGDPSRPYPTFSLALAMSADAHWSALAPTAALRRWRLIEFAVDAPLTLARLRIDERIMHFLAGVSHLDGRLATLVRPIDDVVHGDLAPSHAAIAARIVATWRHAASPAPVVQLCGDQLDCRPLASAVAASLGGRAAIVDAGLVPASAVELDATLQLLEREARLSGLGVLLVETDEAEAGAIEPRAPNASVTRLAERLDGLVILGERERRRIGQRASVAFDIRHPLAREQRDCWHAALNVTADADGATSAPIDAVCAQFDLPDALIRSIAAEALAIGRSAADDGAATAALWELCRARLRARLDSLAQRIESRHSWDDLVLPGGEIAILQTIVAQLRQRTTVYDRWGFAAKSARGLGISALFVGPSGTGKTMAAEVLANQLRLDLYRIDLSAVMSKYIGETEKNLRRVFDAAEESGAILLFDEADAMFGKRSEVKDSHDRYANIEVSYLLQRMEAYRGLAILTTNMRSALDPAFLRRLRFVVQFSFPDAPEREAIWRRVFPPAAPTQGLDPARLAQLRVAGGNIRNIAMSAAFLAADAAEPVRMTHVLAAARHEYAKLERPLTAAESEGWE